MNHRLAFRSILLVLFVLSPFAGRTEKADELNPPFPRWVFGHVVWEDESTTQKTYDLVDGYLERGVPVDAVIIDSPWETAYNTFEFDEKLYPNAQKLIDDLHAMNIKVIMWITSMVNLEDPEYDFCREQHYFVKGMEKTTWWKGKGGMIDYKNPEAVEWWHRRMDKVIAMGIDGWKCDGTDPFMLLKGWKARQDYATAYYTDFYRYTRERSGRPTVIMARPMEQATDETELGLPGWTNPFGLGLYLKFAPREVSFMSWVGDQDPTFDGLKVALRWMLKSARNDYLIMGSDVGGYREGGPSKEVLIRWAQLGALMPFMENGGGGEHRPWMFDDQTLEIYRAYVLMHQALEDYFYYTAVERWRAKRSLVTVQAAGKDHYLLGPDLLVAPIVGAGGKKTVVLPRGANWRPVFKEVLDSPQAKRCLAGEGVLKGGCAFSHVYSLAAYPLFVRDGVQSPFHFGGPKAFPGLEDVVVAEMSSIEKVLYGY